PHTGPFLCHAPSNLFWSSLWLFSVSLFSMSFYSVMPAPNSAMKAGHSGKSQKPADLHRNHLPACSGIGCRHATGMGCRLGADFPVIEYLSNFVLFRTILTTSKPLSADMKD